jgi:hypothetical protein
MFHVWFIPALLVLVAALVVLYLVLRLRGGTGVRTSGRTLVDEQQDETDLPPE